MANRIEILRNAQGINRTQLAATLGVSERTVYRWERDQVQIPDEQKLALSRLLKTSVPFLMGWDREPEPVENGNGITGVA